jgi:hypothetical protein
MNVFHLHFCRPQAEYVGRLRPKTAVEAGRPLSDKDAFVDFIPTDPKAPALLVPRLDCPFL